jgi:hypothetical protein
MGAKALEVEGAARDFQSVDDKLNQIGGAGRVVLTASGPMERAWESARLGHGFLTLHLVEALQGPEEIREGAQVSVLRLLDYVVRRVVDAARQIRREQQPTIRGTFDGEFRWPVLVPGALSTCHYLRDEIVGGEAAQVYSMRTEVDGSINDHTIWISKSRGLYLRQESDISVSGSESDKRHISTRYEYTNVHAPQM